MNSSYDMSRNKVNRRIFLSRSAAIGLGLTVVPRHVLGGTGYVPPSDQLTKGIIGTGG